MPFSLRSFLLLANNIHMIAYSVAFGIRCCIVPCRSRGISHLWLSTAASSTENNPYSNSSSSSSKNHTKRAALLSYAEILLQENGSLHPSDLLSNSSIPFPTSLSPSAAAEFKACPQSYLFQYLYGIRPPINLVLAKGTMCHSALENLFDLEPSLRTLENLQNQFRLVWSKERLQETYIHLFDEVVVVESDADTEVIDSGLSSVSRTGKHMIRRNIEAERQWGLDALKLLENYYRLEDPRLVPRPNPLEREIWVQAKLNIDPTKGATAVPHVVRKEEDSSVVSSFDDEKTFLVRGIVDRLDYVAISPSSPQDTFTKEQNGQSPKTGVRIVDYKTGKAPDFKYSPSTNERIAHQNMWQLKVYALLLKEMIANGNTNSKGGNLQHLESKDIRLLRLMYLTSEGGEARYLDMDLGESEEEQNQVLQGVHADLSAIWTGICELIQRQDPRCFRHCDRKFCICHTLRPKFITGTLYQDGEALNMEE